MHFCRVHLIFFVFLVAWSTVERANKGGGKEAHDRHASPSVRTCFFLLHLLFLLRTSEGPWSGFRDAGESGRARRTKEEEPDARRGERMIKREGREDKRERERERDWRATEAGDAEPNRAGYRCIGRWLSGIRACSTLEEFCPLLLFFPLFLFRRSVPVRLRSPASSCVK